VPVGGNNNWGDSTNVQQIEEKAAALGAFPLDRRGLDAALFTGLPPGAYTAQVSGKTTIGVALVELYEDRLDPALRLVNVSARAPVGTGGDILIAGLYVDGNAPKRLLLRAVGPSLIPYAVTGALANPQLIVTQILAGGATAVAGTNDDWWTCGGATSLPPVFSSVGAFPLLAQSADAALVISLTPGRYTVQVSGAGNTTGVALVEIYEVP